MLTDGRTTDGRTTDAEVTGILIAHLGAFGSGELKICHMQNVKCLMFFKSTRLVCNHLYLNSIKTALKTLIFFKNLIFAF